MDERQELIQAAQALQTKVNALLPNEFQKFNSDGWANVFTGMGTTGYDKRMATEFTASYEFDKTTLMEMYAGDGVLTKMINIPVEDSIREGFFIEGDPEGLVLDELDSLKFNNNLFEARVWTRLFGGAVMLLLIADGRELNEPVDENAIETIRGIQVYDRWDVTWNSDDLYDDPEEANFGAPEFYTLHNRSIGKSFPVHESRLIRFDGELVDHERRSKNNGWGNSIVKQWYERIRGLADSLAAGEATITEFILGLLKMKNLNSLLDSPNGSQKIKDRLQIIDMAKHILNSIVVDEKEDYSRLTSSGVTGMADLLEIFKGMCSTVSGIPRIKLFGEQSQGLGSSADGNVKFYYDSVAFEQEMKYTDAIRKISRYIMLQQQGPFKGIEIESWSVVFYPLWQQTEKEIAETRKITAETDLIYYQMGVPIEVIMLNRFGGSRYSSELLLPDKYAEQLQKRVEGLTYEEFNNGVDTETEENITQSEE